MLAGANAGMTPQLSSHCLFAVSSLTTLEGRARLPLQTAERPRYDFAGYLAVHQAPSLRRPHGRPSRFCLLSHGKLSIFNSNRAGARPALVVDVQVRVTRRAAPGACSPPRARSETSPSKSQLASSTPSAFPAPSQCIPCATAAVWRPVHPHAAASAEQAARCAAELASVRGASRQNTPGLHLRGPARQPARATLDDGRGLVLVVVGGVCAGAAVSSGHPPRQACRHPARRHRASHLVSFRVLQAPAPIRSAALVAVTLRHKAAAASSTTHQQTSTRAGALLRRRAGRARAGAHSRS